MSGFNELLMVIGEAGELTEANAKFHAQQLQQWACNNPTANITMSIFGYDDDPRELWEIDEVIEYIKLFAAEMHRLGLPPRFAARLTPESLKWRAVVQH